MFAFRLHLQNAELCKKQTKLENRVHKDGKEFEGVTKFGFHINTCCGYLEMDNTWKDDWPVGCLMLFLISLMSQSTIFSNVQTEPLTDLTL